MTNNGCTGINCPFQHTKIVQCDLTDCPYRDRPQNSRGAQGDAFTAAFQFGLQQGILMACDHADLTSVVRCKDCAFSSVITAADSGNPLLLLCKRFDAQRRVWPDDYCSYGRRKDEKRSDDIHNKDG